MTLANSLPDLLRSWLATDLVVIDVGARWGVGDRWLRFGPQVKIIGFDPDEDECARLNDASSHSDSECPSVRYVAAALGPSVGTATLHLTVEPACSSLYPPLEALIPARPDLSCIAPAGTTTLEITTLDAWAHSDGVARVDVLKLDTQGSELGVLQGAIRVLDGVSLIEVEVEFNEIYEGQPLFGDVDRFLREHGFVLWRLQQLVHYGFDGPSAADVALPDRHFFDSQPVDVAGKGGQLFWGHAYFVARHLAFPTPRQLPWAEAVRAACAATAFGFTDLAINTLHQAINKPDGVAATLDQMA